MGAQSSQPTSQSMHIRSSEPSEVRSKVEYFGVWLRCITSTIVRTLVARLLLLSFISLMSMSSLFKVASVPGYDLGLNPGNGTVKYAVH